MVPGGRPDLRGDRDALSDAAGDRRVFVVFNPASGRGRGRRRIPRFLELLAERLPDFAFAETERAGQEAELVDRALDEGFDTVAAAGGDGTWSHVADRILASGRRDIRFAALPSGTGNDFGRNVGLDYRDMASAVEALARGRTRPVDVGRVATPCRPDEHPDREPAPRHFLNLVGFGFDVAVIDAAAGARFLKGEVLYKVTALQQLFRFPGVHARIRGDDGPLASDRHLMITVSNGRFFGGGFPIAPDAEVDDGRLHACLIGDAAPLRRLQLFNAAGSGQHVRSDRVRVEGSRRFHLAFDHAPLRFEVDGDVFRAEGSELEVEVLPGALQLVTP